MLLGGRISEALAVRLTHFLRSKTICIPFTISTSYSGKQKDGRSSFSYGATSQIGMVGKDKTDTVTVPLRMFLMVDAKAGAPGASFLSS